MEALPAESCRCPLCRGYFREPVSIPCGHHFCRGCIERRSRRVRFRCPRCRSPAPPRSLRPSPELQRLLEIARGLSLPARRDEEEEEEEDEEGCRQHREPLELFCREDGALLCAICRESRAHRAHRLLPLAEALRDGQEQIQAELRTLSGDRDKLLALREAEMRRSWEFLERTGAERQRVLAQFQGLGRTLQELARHLLARLGRLESELGRAQEENLTRLTTEISRLESRLQELREKCREPARTFLQDIKDTLSSLGKEQLPLPRSPLPELEQRFHRFGEEQALLEETLRGFQDILMFELPERMTVTLEPSTAHPQLLVAPDGGSVRWESTGDGTGTGTDPLGVGAESGTDPPGDGTGAGTGLGPGTGTDTPGTGTDPPGDGPGTGPGPGPGPGPDPSVLGRQAIAAGRRCWDVLVSPAGSWAVGVARVTPGVGAETLGVGAETPGMGTETPGMGTEPPGMGAETPGVGRETPGVGTETLGMGVEPPGMGAEPPGVGAEPPGMGAEPPGMGAETLGMGTETLGVGTEPPGMGAEPPGMGTEPPGMGTEPPEVGAEPPGVGTEPPEVGAEPPGVGTEPPEVGAEPPGSAGPELWSLALWQGRLWALTALERIPLFPARAPSRVRVALDYERGQVAFFDAEQRSLIFAFPAASFKGQSVHPWFLVWGRGSWITLCP